MISETPCKNIILPRGTKKEKAIYTVDEVKTLFKLIDEHNSTIRLKAFVNLAVYGGFRRGEIMGLEWKDIDWDNNVVSIRRTSNYTHNDGIFTDTTKTKRSERSLKLPDSVFAVLKQLYDEQQTQKANVGNKWVDCDRLFVTWNGTPLFCGTPYVWLKKFTKKHGMRFCDLHSFRHRNHTKTHLSQRALLKQMSPCIKTAAAMLYALLQFQLIITGSDSVEGADIVFSTIFLLLVNVFYT